MGVCGGWSVNTLRPRQNGRHFPDNIFLNQKVWIPINISLEFVPKGPINNIPALFQIMAWRRPGDNPLSETMLVSLLTHICITWPQCVNSANVGLGLEWWLPFSPIYFMKYPFKSWRLFLYTEMPIPCSAYVKICPLCVQANLLPDIMEFCWPFGILLNKKLETNLS